MRAKSKRLGVHLVLLFSISCGIVLEIDLSNDQVVIVAPSDSVTIGNGEVRFKWELLEGATAYELLVVSPKFEQIENIVLDTILDVINSHVITLDPGEYEWSLKAKNSAYSTPEQIRSFNVPDSSEILGLNQVIVKRLSPKSDQVWTSKPVVFTWEEVENAEVYNLVVVAPSFEEPIKIMLDTQILTNKYELPLSNGEYQWGVEAENEYSTSAFVEVSFVVDFEEVDISLSQVALNAPLVDAVIETEKIVFWWEELEGAETYEILVMSPSFENPTEVILDSTLTQNKIEIDIDPGNYEWRVIAANGSYKSTPIGRQFSVVE